MITRLLHTVRNVVRHDRVERELDDEVRAAFDLLVEEKLRAGMSSEAARRAAAIGLQVESVKEHVRDVRAGSFVDTLVQDARFATRLLRRNPGFTATIALTLAFGIGANTVIFSICNTLLLKPLPYLDADRIVMVWEQLPDLPRVGVAPANFVDWRQQARSFSRMAAVNPFPTFVLNRSGEAVRLSGGGRLVGLLFSPRCASQSRTKLFAG